MRRPDRLVGEHLAPDPVAGMRSMSCLYLLTRCLGVGIEPMRISTALGSKAVDAAARFGAACTSDSSLSEDLPRPDNTPSACCRTAFGSALMRASNSRECSRSPAGSSGAARSWASSTSANWYPGLLRPPGISVRCQSMMRFRMISAANVSSEQPASGLNFLSASSAPIRAIWRTSSMSALAGILRCAASATRRASGSRSRRAWLLATLRCRHRLLAGPEHAHRTLH